MRLRFLQFITLLLFLITSVSAATNAPAALSAAEAERIATPLIQDWGNAYNKHDLNEWEKLYHFPHYRLASGKMTVLERAGEQDASKVWPKDSEAHHTAWDHIRVIAAGTDKIHVDTQYSVYKKDGSKTATFHSFFILTKENDRWGVKMRSSFAP